MGLGTWRRLTKILTKTWVAATIEEKVGCNQQQDVTDVTSKSN